MEKRQCRRFKIPGAVLYYRKSPLFWGRGTYPDAYYPVLDISRGGLCFVTNDRIKVGLPVHIKIQIPGLDHPPEIQATVRWISRNREESYRYQTGVSFNAYGEGKKDNPAKILTLIKTLETNFLLLSF